MIPLRIILLAAGVALASGSAALWLATHRKSPEERERQRRTMLNAIGRLTDGTVLDVNEIEDPKLGAQQLLVYTYDVGGVQYECSQESHTSASSSTCTRAAWDCRPASNTIRTTRATRL